MLFFLALSFPLSSCFCHLTFRSVVGWTNSSYVEVVKYSNKCDIETAQNIDTHLSSSSLSFATSHIPNLWPFQFWNPEFPFTLVNLWVLVSQHSFPNLHTFYYTILLVQIKGTNQSLMAYRIVWLSFFFCAVFISFLILYYFETYIWMLTCKMNGDRVVYTGQTFKLNDSKKKKGEKTPL